MIVPVSSSVACAQLFFPLASSSCQEIDSIFFNADALLKCIEIINEVK
jgi:hypothetical protein